MQQLLHSDDVLMNWGEENHLSQPVLSFWALQRGMMFSKACLAKAVTIE